MKPVNLGIVGCGIAARELHWPALRKLQDKFKISLVCNRTEPKAKAFAEMVGGVPYVLDYREVLRNPQVEAVSIVLPIHLNYQVTRAALEAGKHVIVEKPLAANRREAEAMLELDSKFPGHVKMVAENFRYHDGFNRVATLIRAGEVGKPYAVFWDIFYFLDADKNKYAQTPWRINHQYPGGFIFDAGVHNIAVLRDLFGDITAGHAFTRSINRRIGEIDTMSFQFTTAQEVCGVVNIFLSVQGYTKNRLLILGTEGSMKLDHAQHLTVQRKDGTALEETLESDSGYRAEFEDFYRAIREGQPPVSDFRQAFEDLRVLLGALEAADGWPALELG